MSDMVQFTVGPRKHALNNVARSRIASIAMNRIPLIIHSEPDRGRPVWANKWAVACRYVQSLDELNASFREALAVRFQDVIIYDFGSMLQATPEDEQLALWGEFVALAGEHTGNLWVYWDQLDLGTRDFRVDGLAHDLGVTPEYVSNCEHHFCYGLHRVCRRLHAMKDEGVVERLLGEVLDPESVSRVAPVVFRILGEVTGTQGLCETETGGERS